MKIFLIAALFILNQVAMGADIGVDADAREIVEKANLAAVYPADDGRAQARMLIVDKQGRKQMRQFSILRKNVELGGDQQFLVIFSRPSDVARTGFLVNKHPGADDDRWLYLPGLDLLKRISAGDKRTSFVGSDFFYEDISGRDVNADDFSILKEDDKTWTLKALPKRPNKVEFEHYTVTISKENNLPLVSNYYDAAGKHYRRLSATKIKAVDGVPTITEMKAENIISGSFTINQLRHVQYNVGMPSSVFSERSLRMPPRKWMSGK